MKKTLVLGASTNPERYAYKAIKLLLSHGHEVVPIGIKKGEVLGLQILDNYEANDINTVTVYLNPQNQENWYNAILKLAPQRIIFNPGTENPEFAQLAQSKGIETEEACTLVLLNTHQY